MLSVTGLLADWSPTPDMPRSPFLGAVGWGPVSELPVPPCPAATHSSWIACHVVQPAPAAAGQKQALEDAERQVSVSIPCNKEQWKKVINIGWC